MGSQFSGDSLVCTYTLEKIAPIQHFAPRPNNVFNEISEDEVSLTLIKAIHSTCSFDTLLPWNLITLMVTILCSLQSHYVFFTIVTEHAVSSNLNIFLEL